MQTADSRENAVNERTLWLAVIEGAVDDVSGGKKPAVWEEARAWIFDKRNAADFEEVCHLAGVDADTVREMCAARLPSTAKIAKAA